MQSLNNAYYRLDFEETSALPKSTTLRAVSAVFKISTIIFAVIAAFSFMEIAMLIGFACGAVLSLVAVFALDYAAGAILYSYVYTVSDKRIIVLKEYKNGKIQTLFDCDCESLTVEDSYSISSEESFIPKNISEKNANILLLTTDLGQKIKIAADDYMTAILRRLCK